MLIEVTLADDRYCDGCPLFDSNEIDNPIFARPSVCALGHELNDGSGFTLRPDACKDAEAAMKDHLKAVLLLQIHGELNART